MEPTAGDPLESIIADLLAKEHTIHDWTTTFLGTEDPSAALTHPPHGIEKGFLSIPWWLVLVAGRCEAKALLVYLAAWRLGLMQATCDVPLTTASLRVSGVTRHQKARALVCLEEAGLVTVVRQRGKNPRIRVRALEAHLERRRRAHREKP
jgi:hypothetical protein